jgi:hypothetical protein
MSESAQFPQIKVVLASKGSSSSSAQTEQIIDPGSPALDGERSVASSKREIGAPFLT